jgi:Tfp pilus assembly protein PilF
MNGDFHMKTHKRTSLLLPALVAACFLGNTVWGQAYIILNNANQQRVDAERLIAKPDGTMVVYREGAAPVEVPRNQYIRAVGVKPAELTQAEQLIAAGQNPQAVQALKQAMQKSRLQSWDVRAGVMLADLQIEANDNNGAKATLRQLETLYGDSLSDLFPEVQMVDWKVRVATGAVAGLQEELTKAIHDADQPRTKKAMAQLVRGDLKKRREELKPAVLDYLRTVYFYPDDPELHAEALYKTADTFAEMGDSVRASKYQNELKAKYPTSTFAGKPIGN